MNKDTLQKIASSVFSSLNVTNQWFEIRNTSDVMAGAWGLYTDMEIPFIGIRGNSVVGFIYVNEKYLPLFNDSEWSFIIAHECSHIFRNHILGAAFWKITERMLRGANDENKVVVGALKLLLAKLSPDKLPPDAITLKNQEYEADEMAVQYTRDLSTAVGCLKKMVGGNLAIASHMWDLIGVPLPAMTIDERINELIKRSITHKIRL